MTRGVHVSAPCRLHFGMFSFGDLDRPQFGGVGVMVSPPAVEVTITPAERFRATGRLANRAEQFAMSALRHWQITERPACEINVRSPRDHIGLGVGTQLGMSIAAGLRRFLGLPELEFPQLSLAVGRGMRSFVGTIGFDRGGMIVDGGKGPGEYLSPFMRDAVPGDWRFVLVLPNDQQGLAGEIETAAFAQLPPVPETVTAELVRISAELTSAAAFEDFDAFGNAVYSFGRLAGECFSAVQGGPFASSEIATLIEAIREHGVPGVGQSSWGPTVFAVTASDTDAQRLVEWLRGRKDLAEYEITVAEPNNHGATIDVL